MIFLKLKSDVHMWSTCPINQFENAESSQNAGLDSDNQGLRDSNPYKYVESVIGFRDVQSMITLGGNTN